MSMLVIDGVKYSLKKPSDEKQLEEAVKKHYKEIFGKDTLYFDVKHKLSSKSGVTSIPDGYVLSLSEPDKWYIVEVELSYHAIHEHITTQLNKFYLGIKNRDTQEELVELLYREISDDKPLKAWVEKTIGTPEIKSYLRDLISESTKITIVIEDKGEEVREACDPLKAEPIVMELKTYERENAPNIHAYLFNPIAEALSSEQGGPKQDIEQKKNAMLEYAKSDELKGIVTECLNRLEQMNLQIKPLSGKGISVSLKGKKRKLRFMYVFPRHKFLKVWVLKPNKKWLESNIRKQEDLEDTFKSKIEPILKEYNAIV
jgi:hypothetical protein